ncbi:hypothetical protein BJ980_002072 [Nocardioides daedukensis]|uniref:Uncharacterized protein n=1 Tax=Nocardioides daedukensis TaxID=634462 RepID=A0A7Y9S1B4_9ACTN|nr:hypothetical protein [Nocardioides daedukensis]NYG59149.1 hypothetical protein [Nocardioides daedukensis]
MNSGNYFTDAELAYRQSRVRDEWKPVRRKRHRLPDLPSVRRPLHDDDVA